MELEEIKEKIAKEANLTREEVDKKIEDKILELSGLVSAEGAAYIVAKEEGLDLLEKRDRRLKIKNIIPKMREVEVVGKIVDISDVREFDKGDKKGKVKSITIGDETGQIRVVFWNDKVNLAENLKEGDVIRIKKGYTKANSFGIPEIHMGTGSNIEIENKDIKLSETKEVKTFSIGERKKLKEIKEGDFIETRAAIVSTSEKEFYTCPNCNSKLEEINGNYVCKDHGKVEPNKNLIIKGYIDDGSATLKFVAFRELAEKIKSENLIGKDKIFIGRVKKNEYFGDPELILNQIEDFDIEREIDLLKTN
ncbi:MAG: hypothetical protein DRP10_02995 [Candidatus Aenigmatarchaeota archaeon]|nr:MAG: hypothetical protein DRP10_02995 [Candidatus Aenigmarchaeota archaeon]